MSSLETKAIKQTSIGGQIQPLYIGGIQPDNSDADLYIDANGEIHIPNIQDQIDSHINTSKVHNNYSTATGTNSYSVTLSPAPTSYVAGMIVSFKASNTNTGSSTLNCNSLGAVAIKKDVNADLIANDIKANQVITVVYDGTNFQVVSGSAGSIEPIAYTGVQRDADANMKTNTTVYFGTNASMQYNGTTKSIDFIFN